MKTFKIISIHLILLSIFILPILVHGQTNTSVGVHITNPFNCGNTDPNKCTLPDLIASVLNNVVMPVAAVGVVIWIIYAGFTFVTAQGKEAEITKAKQRLLWSLIGAGILLGAAGISAVVSSTIQSLVSTN